MYIKATNFQFSKVKMCGSSGEENEFLKEKLSRESALELAKLLVKKRYFMGGH